MRILIFTLLGPRTPAVPTALIVREEEVDAANRIVADALG
jgi:hypothetical protein